MEGEEEIWQCDSTFWFATLQPLVADEATMHYLKGDMFSFNMRHKILICHHRLQSGRPKCWITLSDFLFPFHNLTWGFCFRLHIIPIFCRIEVDGCALPEQARVSTPWLEIPFLLTLNSERCQTTTVSVASVGEIGLSCGGSAKWHYPSDRPQRWQDKENKCLWQVVK